MQALRRQLGNTWRKFKSKWGHRRYDLIQVGLDGFWTNRSIPSLSLMSAAKLFNEISGKIIVEIGTGIHGELAGNSMLVWPVETRATRIIAVDLEPARIEEVRSKTSQYANVETVIGDGIAFLASFDSKIDLLYLDFWTDDPDGELVGTGRALAYQQAYAAAKEKLNSRSMILIDDTDHVHPRKHTFIIPDARKDGFVVKYGGRQTLLMRNLAG